MKLLILGGTVFLGRHLVEAALARGHELTLFNRGQHNADLFPQVEKLRGDRDGDFQFDRFFCKTGAQGDVGSALLAIAFQRIAGHGCAEEQQVIEIGQAALGAETPDLVDALVGSPVYFGEHFQGECCRWSKWILFAHVSSTLESG